MKKTVKILALSVAALISIIIILLIVGHLTGYIEVGMAKFENTSVQAKATFEATLTDFSSDSIVHKDLKDKIVFFNSWATWCGPCRQELPSLNEIMKRNHNSNVIFISYCSDIPAKQVEPFLKSHNEVFNFNLISSKEGLRSAMRKCVFYHGIADDTLTDVLPMNLIFKNDSVLFYRSGSIPDSAIDSLVDIIR